MEQLHQEAQLNLQSLLQGSGARGAGGGGLGWVLPGRAPAMPTARSSPTLSGCSDLARPWKLGPRGVPASSSPSPSLLPGSKAAGAEELPAPARLCPRGPCSPGDELSAAGFVSSQFRHQAVTRPRLGCFAGVDEIRSPACRRLVISLTQPEQTCFPPGHSHRH